MTELRILDCTLRDGGFYTDWSFEPGLVRAVVGALDLAGVDVIELGYRSPKRGRNGVFKYCDETVLRSYLPSIRRAQLAFMIDVKDFVTGTTIDTHSLAQVIAPRRQSRFAWARVASHVESIEQAFEIASWLRERGYSVATNVMGITTADPLSLTRIFDGATDVDVLYLADSFGDLTPERTTALVANARTRFAGNLGVHLHDNLGLALANAVAAISAGATYIDTTLAGMGRGAGNVRTEQLLPLLDDARNARDPSALVPALSHHMRTLHERHGWGANYAYMVCALSRIHPTYCQELESRGYDLEQVVGILEAIAPAKRERFDGSALAVAEGRHTERILQRRSS